MKLTDLDAVLIRSNPDGWQEGVPMRLAQGVMFLCPKCYRENRGPQGTHQVLCWSDSAGAPKDALPSGRWALRGSGVEDLTLAAEPGRTSSVLIVGGCAAHFHVAGGSVKMCP
jgi:hypothetical protein